MSWQPYAIAGLLVVALAAAGALVALLGVDSSMILGLAGGALLGGGLAAFGVWSLKRSLAQPARKLALGHVYGGFMLRLVVLCAGFFTLVATGWANPAGFAVAFMLTVLVNLGLQVTLTARSLERAKAATRAA